MGLMYFLKKWICKQFENKFMNLILNLSFYQKSGIPDKEGKMASLLTLCYKANVDPLQHVKYDECETGK